MTVTVFNLHPFKQKWPIKSVFVEPYLAWGGGGGHIVPALTLTN